jgi:transcriptional regulator with GAF, ATPase, and Fis domain
MVEREIVGSSEAIRRAVAQADRAGATGEPVLLLGESGTGKELLARRIHAASAHARGPFVAINCGALPEAIVESTLFGHEKGAFTGAVVAQKGKFELAAGGTLFLDEVGEMSLAVQVKLLRALQEGVIEPVGWQEKEPRPIDVRVVAATNRDLGAMIAAGQFREDFYYRLEVLTIQVPPLRERREDIPALVRHFLRSAENTASLQIEDEALALMAGYRWPGNVRELGNFVKKAALAAEGGCVGAAEIARLLADADRTVRRVAAPVNATHPGGQTRPAATTISRPAGVSGLALAWWRFRAIQNDEGQPYVCRVAALEQAQVSAVEFSGNRARLGRERGQVEVMLETGEVSRCHATITATEEGFAVEDADSRNGTFVDGRPLSRGTRASLRSGSVLRIGKEWLGIAAEVGPTGWRGLSFAPVALAAAHRLAQGSPEAEIDIRAVEVICANGAAPEELEAIARRLARIGGVIREGEARQALPDRTARPAALAMSAEELQGVVDSLGGNKRKAARQLGISHTTLHERLKGRR